MYVLYRFWDIVSHLSQVASRKFFVPQYIWQRLRWDEPLWNFTITTSSVTKQVPGLSCGVRVMKKPFWYHSNYSVVSHGKICLSALKSSLFNNFFIKREILAAKLLWNLNVNKNICLLLSSSRLWWQWFICDTCSWSCHTCLHGDLGALLNYSRETSPSRASIALAQTIPHKNTCRCYLFTVSNSSPVLSMLTNCIMHAQPKLLIFL